MPTNHAPRSFLWQPDQFGRRKDPKWKPQPSTMRVALAEAAVQHEVSYALLLEIGDSAEGLRSLAKRTGEDPNYLRRRLHGQVRSELKQYFEWALIFGVHILPERLSPQNTFELIPKTEESGQLRLAQ